MTKKVVVILFLVVSFTLLFAFTLKFTPAAFLSLALALAAALVLVQSIQKSLQKKEDSIRSLFQNIEEKIDQLKREKEEMDTILRSMVEHVVAVDEGGSILYLNNVTENALSIKSAEAMGKHFVEVVRHAALNELLTSILTSKEELDREIELFLPESRHFEVRAVPLPLKNGKSGVLLVMHDITRIHNLEVVRKDFIANVSHELGTPLTSIRGYAETLLSGAIADTKHNREFLQFILTESERLSRLVEDLLDLSAIESGSERLKKSLFSLEELLREVLDNCKTLAKEKEVTLENISGKELPKINADRDKIKQVFLNLLDNAIKFNHKDGKVTLESRIAEKTFVILVKDTGVSIPSADIPRIFERFYRVDKDRSRKLGGTGLGLAIVKHIVNLHGGAIQATSAPNEGSTFSITLPFDGSPIPKHCHIPDI